MRKLALDDIKDLRAYERERDDFRRQIIEMKKRRRIALGDLMTITFENTATMRFQIQEMARAERMLSDEQIQHEINTYNELIPDEGELSGTLFLELTSDELLRLWLPDLVGIQRAISFRLSDGSMAPSIPQDEERLTREATTATVHYLKFRFTTAQIEAFDKPGTAIVVDHPKYRAETELTDAPRAELAGDLKITRE